MGHRRRGVALAAVGALTVAAGSLPALSASAAASHNSAMITSTALSGSGRYQDLATAPYHAPGKNKDGGRDDYVKLTDTHRVKKSTDVRGSSAPAAAPVLKGVNFSGTNETQSGSFPPDNEISVGPKNVLQTTNFAVAIYKKTGALVTRKNFNTFFGSSGEFIFDPRTYYDPYWNRFVVTADGQQGSGSTAQSFMWLAISTGSSATGGYFIYHFIPGTPAGDFVDFPQLGMDLDSVIITFNDFLGGGGFDARVFAVSKALVYNDFGFSVPIFGGSGCTIAPPFVLDNNGKTFLLTACPNDNRLFLGAMTNSGRTNVSVLFWQAIISVTGFTTPPTAPQPGVNYPLETSTGNAFENRSYQAGNNLMNVHVVTVGTATPRWYDINTSSNTVTSTGEWFATGSSSDWRPHLAFNSAGEVFGTWMSVDASINVNLQVRFTGGQAFNAGGTAGTLLFQSTQPLTNQTFPAGRNRTGDYGSAALDPSHYGSCASDRRAYVVGEDTFNAGNWGSQIGRIGFC